MKNSIILWELTIYSNNNLADFTRLGTSEQINIDIHTT